MRTAIVTGGSRGIGRAIVHRLTADGTAVAFCYHSDADAARHVVDAVAETGGRALAVRADLADLEQLRELFERADKWFGELSESGLDILVNNAAVAVVEPVESVPLGRLGQPDDIAAVVAFLTGPDGRWVTGQQINVSGGLA